MRGGGDDHNLLVPPYPTELARRAWSRLRHRRHSSRRQWGHRPILGHLWSARRRLAHHNHQDISLKTVGSREGVGSRRRIVRSSTEPHRHRVPAEGKGGCFTSGKVPLEKTLSASIWSAKG